MQNTWYLSLPHPYYTYDRLRKQAKEAKKIAKDMQLAESAVLK